jgi:hypothetical protein
MTPNVVRALDLADRETLTSARRGFALPLNAAVDVRRARR